MPQTDLVLLHPPSVYDFRQQSIMYGPISDLIPSSPVFEMYPLGFLTITNHLEARGFKVRIINLALRMMNDRKFDVPDFLAKLNTQAFGIDLHWLPHAQGSLAVAKLLKEIFPQLPVIFGGLTASYYHRELIVYPQVDYVLRGDSIEPPLEQLLDCLRAGRSPENVPNLTWQKGQELRVNALSFVPQSLDYVDLQPARMIKMVLRHRDLQSVLPFNGWWQNPITAIFNVKGCAHQCITCGSSADASQQLCARPAPAFRSPENLVKNIIDISRFSRGPIFLVGDLQEAGEEYLQQVLDLLQRARISNQIVFEVFGMPRAGFLPAIDRAVKNWSLELSPESHAEELRRVQDERVYYSNAEMEAVIDQALTLRCQRLDVFFMLGLSGQTRDSVLATIDYCEELFKRSDRRLSCFISPLGPFLDPGSCAFEEPERFGYRLLAKSLEEHRQLLLQPSWTQILNYETEWMSREELVEVTYDAAERLNALKLQYQRISSSRGKEVACRIIRARALKDRLQQVDRHQALPSAELMGEIHEYSVSTVCDKRELFWRRHLLNFKLLGILRISLEYLFEALQSTLSSWRDKVAEK